MGLLSTEQQLATMDVPLRDLRDLTVRLNPTIDQVPLTVNDQPPSYAVGDAQEFWVHNTDTQTNLPVMATLIYSTSVAYVWVESGQTYNLDAIARSIDRFSSVSYPNEVATFGSEWNPGVDADPRLHVLYSNQMGGGVAGYYYSADEYSRLANAFSNEKEMFYINLDYLNRGQNYTEGETVLAHEFQHMIHWHMDRGEDIWINEGLSEYAPQAAQYPASVPFVNGFAANPDLQLTAWSPYPGRQRPALRQRLSVYRLSGAAVWPGFPGYVGG